MRKALYNWTLQYNCTTVHVYSTVQLYTRVRLHKCTCYITKQLGSTVQITTVLYSTVVSQQEAPGSR